MFGCNHVILAGTIESENDFHELRRTKVANVRLGVPDWKWINGNVKHVISVVQVSLWGENAERIRNSPVGTKIMIGGLLTINKDSYGRSSIQVSVQKVQIIDEHEPEPVPTSDDDDDGPASGDSWNELYQ